MKIIHISDLHYKINWDEEIGFVFNKFLDDLAKIVTDDCDWRLVFSGDLVKAGSDKILYDSLLEELGNRLDKIGIGKDKRYVTPGNHDVSQVEVSKHLLVHMGSLSQLDRERSFNDALSDELPSVLFPKFANFQSFAKQFVSEENYISSVTGGGLTLTEKVGAYFLNTALTSHGGVCDKQGRPISDDGNLSVDTRSLHKWLQSSKHSSRILIMHHPLRWLVPWAEEEIEGIIHDNFCAVFSGHVHRQRVKCVRQGYGSAVHCAAPPLFTAKSEVLGYTIIDLRDNEIEVTYRQWNKPSGFVLSTMMAGNDNGKVTFRLGEGSIEAPRQEVESQESVSTIDILKSDFEKAATCYSSYQGIWIEREFADLPESRAKGKDFVVYSIEDLVKVNEDLAIQAPHEFGLTSVGRQYALQYAIRHDRYMLFLSFEDLQPHRSAVEDAVNSEVNRLGISSSEIDGFIFDDFEFGKKSRRVMKSLEDAFGKKVLVALISVEETPQLGTLNETDQISSFKKVYLWTLSRQAIRRIVETYGSHCQHLDDEALSKKVVADLDSLNIPRTPINCLTLIKINEQDAEDSPVNRTEMIRRVFLLFFIQFEGLPRYASRPDMLDSEYVLGVFAEFLVREKRGSFTKSEFLEKVSAYCKVQFLNIEADVLFLILISEGILTQRNGRFEFRFSFWLHFFAAHRMHHNPEFAVYMLSDKRYTSFPLLLEFYSGLDRRRSDAVKVLIKDMKDMESGFRLRSGIPSDLNPYLLAEWRPSEKVIEAMEKEVRDGVSMTSLPADLKDELADKGRDRSKAYDQEITKFVEESTLQEYVSAMLGASRVLRNSDHVDPKLRKELLDCVLSCWVGFCQILVVLSDVLVGKGIASFEGIGFYLDGSFKDKTPEEKWYALLQSIPYNVCSWFNDEIFSKKLGPLLVDYLKSNNNSIGGLLGRRILVMHRPPGWKQELSNFIISENKNSFFLYDLNSSLRNELKTGILSEKASSEIKELSATAVAKHATGKKNPDRKLISKVSEDIEKREKEQE